MFMDSRLRGNDWVNGGAHLLRRKVPQLNIEGRSAGTNALEWILSHQDRRNLILATRQPNNTCGDPDAI
jgi:hypothetical protein